MAENLKTNANDGPQPMPGGGAWDLFLSYATEDENWVRPLAKKLASLSLRVFDPVATPSEFWGMSLEQVLAAIFPAQCTAILVVISAKYSASEHNTSELALISEAATDSGEKSIVLPVRLDDSPVPKALRTVAILDARGIQPEAVAEMVAHRFREWKKAGESPDRAAPRATERALGQAVASVLMEMTSHELAYLRKSFPDVDAEEVVSEAIRQWLKAKHAPDGYLLPGYLHHMVRSLARKQSRRQRARHVSNFDFVNNDILSPAPPISPEDVEELKRAIEMLPDIDRQIISKRYLDGLTVSELAQQLDISISTVYSRLQRVLTQLRSMLKAEA
jgi:RNA polymerase sigma factor (sigma-70 family)